MIVSFSARKGGNCEALAEEIQSRIPGSDTLWFADLNVQLCARCAYECIYKGVCKYRDDDLYDFYEKTRAYDKVFYIVPMYSGNPSSLFFLSQERGQGYWSENEEYYPEFTRKLYIVGIGNTNEQTSFSYPFLNLLEHSKGKMLILEPHRYGLGSLDTPLLKKRAVYDDLHRFLDVCLQH